MIVKTRPRHRGHIENTVTPRSRILAGRDQTHPNDRYRRDHRARDHVERRRTTTRARLRRLLHRQDHARRLLPFRRRRTGDRRARARRLRWSMAGQPHAPRGRHQPRQIPVRSDRSRDERRHLLTRLRIDLRRMGNDGGLQDAASHVPRVAALSVAEAARAGRAEEARRREQRSARSGQPSSIPSRAP